MNPINSFTGKYRFLSNFFVSGSWFDYQGLKYDNVECAYQAAKTHDKFHKEAIRNLPPGRAKAYGKKVDLIPNWEELKFDIMEELVIAKFSHGTTLASRLVGTGTAHLEEGNSWGDKYWGTVNGQGQNKLGLILMDVRKRLGPVVPKLDDDF